MKNEQNDLPNVEINNFPWLEIAAGGVGGIASGMIVFQSFYNDFIAKFPEINEKLGLDIKTFDDFKHYWDEENKLLKGNWFPKSDNQNVRQEAINRKNVLKEYMLGEEHLNVMVLTTIVAGVVVGIGTHIVKEMARTPEPKPNNNIVQPFFPSQHPLNELEPSVQIKK